MIHITCRGCKMKAVYKNLISAEMMGWEEITFEPEEDSPEYTDEHKGTCPACSWK